jgi:hypothetical protein
MTVGLCLSAAILLFIGSQVVRGVWRAPRLAREVLAADHEDWWAAVSNGHLVGGGPRPEFAFVANHGGNIPMYLCAFDHKMLILVNCRNNRSTGWLKEHARLRVGRRGFAEVIEVNGSSRIAVWRPRLAEVAVELRRAGWQVDDGQCVGRETSP